MIRVQTVDLAYTYPSGSKAIDGISFDAEAGEFVALMGPNGSGKTTLLKHLIGLLRPTAGKVILDGRDISSAAVSWVRGTVGYVFQDPNDQLFAATVEEDVAFGPRNLGLAPEEVRERVAQALEWVGLSGFEARPVHSLSYGQKRRAALAGVLAMSPKVLVLDEPSSGLDPMTATRMMALLYRFNQQHGTTVIVATHDVDLVPAHATKVYLMASGRVLTCGPPPSVFTQTSVLRKCDLRVPRAAQALKLVGDELGHPLIDLPLTMEEIVPSQTRGGNGYLEGMSGTNAGKDCRQGFTTGAAAAAAAKAAAELVVNNRTVSAVELRSPLGATSMIPVHNVARGDDGVGAVAMVVKAGFGENDVTNGARICAFVTMSNVPGISIDGGEGVGRVTRPGLPMGVGSAAINPVPRQMIADAVSSVLPAGMGVNVVINVPGGEELARETVNPQLGIVGGIAILGTIEAVEPAVIVGQRRWVSMDGMKKAVLLLGHGSRAQDANEAMYQVADLIRQETDYEIVELAFMGLNPPSIDQGVDTCVARGASKIIVVPYFLHWGNHVQKDLPEMLGRIRTKHPNVQLVLGNHIGFHPKLAEIIVERIEENDGGIDG